MSKKPQIRQAPNTIAIGRVNLKEERFEALVYQKGKDVIWESAIKCPCKLDGRSNLPTCVNCGGIGWVFVNPIKTKMIVQSMNITSKTSNWSVERVGMANITTRADDAVSDMDRITMTMSSSKFSQILRSVIADNKLFAFTNYSIDKILDVFMFVGDRKPLVLLEPSKYSFDGNKIILDKRLTKDDLTITVRYIHKVQYFVIDITREIRESTTDGAGSKARPVTKLPLSCVGRRCHYVINPDNVKEPSVVDNSYKTTPDKPYNVTD